MPLSPSATRDLLAQLGHTPKRFLGQNFLVDGNIVRKSLELAQIAPGDTVVEIGPGLGTLTAALLEAGAEVWAVEKDRSLHAHLAETLVPRFPHTLHLIEGDAIELPLAGLRFPERPTQEVERPAGALAAATTDATTAPTAGATEPRDANVASPWVKPESTTATANFKIVANLPYAISTPWLDAVLSGPLPARLVLMLQLEAAQRYIARPGTKLFGSISIFLQSAYAVAPGHTVASACFFPRPDVDSHLLHLVRNPAPFVFAPKVKTLIRACFQQRRKQLGSLLRARLPDHGQAWLDLISAAGFSPRSRPEEIPAALWQRLTIPD